MKLTNEQHARILSRYLGKLSLGGFRAIVKAHEDYWHACMNLSTGNQIRAHEQAELAAKQEFERMLDHDKQHLSEVVQAMANAELLKALKDILDANELDRDVPSAVTNRHRREAELHGHYLLGKLG